MITSSAAGKCGRYRCRFICDFSRSVGVGRTTIPEHPGADPLDDPLDRAALSTAGSASTAVATFLSDDNFATIAFAVGAADGRSTTT